MHAPFIEELDITHYVERKPRVPALHVPPHLPHLPGASEGLLYGPGKFFCRSLRTLSIDDGRVDRFQRNDLLTALYLGCFGILTSA